MIKFLDCVLVAFLHLIFVRSSISDDDALCIEGTLHNRLSFGFKKEYIARQVELNAKTLNECLKISRHCFTMTRKLLLCFMTKSLSALTNNNSQFTSPFPSSNSQS